MGGGICGWFCVRMMCFAKSKRFPCLTKAGVSWEPNFYGGGECFSVLNPKLDDWKRSDLKFSVLPGILWRLNSKAWCAQVFIFFSPCFAGWWHTREAALRSCRQVWNGKKQSSTCTCPVTNLAQIHMRHRLPENCVHWLRGLLWLNPPWNWNSAKKPVPIVEMFSDYWKENKSENLKNIFVSFAGRGAQHDAGLDPDGGFNFCIRYQTRASWSTCTGVTLGSEGKRQELVWMGLPLPWLFGNKENEKCCHCAHQSASSL